MAAKNPITPLEAETLAADPRIVEAQNLLIEAISEHSARITSVRPPREERTLSYSKLLHTLEQCRGSSLYYPYLGSGIGNGALVELLDGSVKYDLIGGIGVHYWGHSHVQLIMASIEAALSNTVMQGNLQQNEDTLTLMQLLLHTSGLDHCFLSSSGVMANENAMKMAFQKRYPASRLLAFTHCFAGRTLFFAHVTDKAEGREGLPRTATVDYVPFFSREDPSFSTEHSLAILRSHLQRYPGEHAAMIFELVQGEGGCYPGTHEFFATLMAECRNNGVAVLVDEVQTFGRTPQLYAFQHFGLEPYVDFVTIGKLAQVCATLYRKEWNPKPGLISQTVTSSTFAIRASQLMIASMLQESYYGPDGKIVQLHRHFVDHLSRMERDYPNLIAGPYGLGCMLAFTPFGGDKQKVQNFAQDLFQAGVIGFPAGKDPTRLRFLLPAGTLTEQDIDQVALLIREVLEKKG